MYLVIFLLIRKVANGFECERFWTRHRCLICRTEKSIKLHIARWVRVAHVHPLDFKLLGKWMLGVVEVQIERAVERIRLRAIERDRIGPGVLG